MYFCCMKTILTITFIAFNFLMIAQPDTNNVKAPTNNVVLYGTGHFVIFFGGFSLSAESQGLVDLNRISNITFSLSVGRTVYSIDHLTKFEKANHITPSVSYLIGRGRFNLDLHTGLSYIIVERSKYGAGNRHLLPYGGIGIKYINRDFNNQLFIKLGVDYPLGVYLGFGLAIF